MTATNDNNIVWLVKITRAGTSWRFATENITLSSNVWDGEALGINDNRFSLNEVGKRINIPGGGTMGEISTVTFTFSRYTDNTFINTFFNEFYPATAGLVLVAMDVEVGIVWDSATTESQITWLHKYNIEEYQYNDSQINLVCAEFSDFEFFNIPYYKVQVEYNNGVSYYPEASEQAIGKNIPICYGRLEMPLNIVPFNSNCCPLVKVGEKKFLLSSHECFNGYTGTTETVNSKIYEEIPEY